MPIYSFFILNKNAGMIFNRDLTVVKNEVDRMFNYPLEVKLDQFGSVKFGGKDQQVKIGMSLMAVNGFKVFFDKMDKNTAKIQDPKGPLDLFEFLNNPANFPIQLKFGKPQLDTNDKLVLTGRFFGLYSLAWQLSPVAHSSGIELIETDQYKLHCFHTITGMKFIAITDSRQQNVDAFLRKAYEIYADYALKNPFHLVDQPIRSDLFINQIQSIADNIDRL